MADLTKLIERLEKATGPDRELDEAIACFIAPPHPKHGKPVGMIFSKEFTRSIDAALTLVPNGWVWDVASTGAVWVMPCDDLEGQIVVGGIASPVIAICVAALKARMYQTGQNHARVRP